MEVLVIEALFFRDTVDISSSGILSPALMNIPGQDTLSNLVPCDLYLLNNSYFIQGSAQVFLIEGLA